MAPKGTLATRFSPRSLPGEPAQKTALLINPPIYDVQYWAQWSQPYGLLRIARLLEKLGYKRRELFDFMETSGEKRTVSKRRKCQESDRLRRVIVEAVDNVTARAFWKEDFDKYDKATVDPPRHKLSKLLISGTASLMLSQPESRIDLRQIMDTGQALLVCLVNPADWATQRMLVEELVSCLGPSLPAHLADRPLDSLVSAYGQLLRLFLQTQGFLASSRHPTETPFSFPPLYG